MRCGDSIVLHDGEGPSSPDLPPEPNFDRITALASTIFGVPAAVLSLGAADQLVPKSTHGFGERGLSAALWFCGLVGCADAPLILPDTQADSRFAGASYAEADSKIRFCAGVPLLSHNGQRIGALCVFGPVPRLDFGAVECGILEGLAQMSVELVESRSQQLRLLERTREIAHLAHHDPLTELSNRRHFDQLLGRAVKGIRPHEEIVVYCVDLDGFKRVNDTMGHASGDLLLREVTQRLRGELRQGDTIARIGGDEFAIVQWGDRVVADAPGFANGIIRAVAQPYNLNGQPARIGTSIGAAVGRFPSPSPDQMLREADQALYRAKRAGRGRFALFDSHRQEVMPTRFAITRLRFEGAAARRGPAAIHS